MNYYERNYYERARALATRTTKPTQTDQSAAKDTDINIIVARFLTTGQAPGKATPPVYADCTQYPEDLRDAIEKARSLQQHMQTLPQPLRGLALEELLALTPDQLTAKLTPPAPPPDDKKETK